MKDGLKITLWSILIFSATGLIVLEYLPQEPRELPNIRTDFDDQKTINRNGSTYDTDKDTIIEGKAVEFKLEKDI